VHETLEYIEDTLHAWWRDLEDTADLAHPDSGQWWPESDPFRVAIGAVLTQNTNWTNVERALGRLDEVDVTDVESLLGLPEAELAERIRPAGYFRVKADRLRQLATAWSQAGGASELAQWETPALRDWLLAIKGIGPETADDILLYGFARPVFVVDAYTRRLLERLGLEAQAGWKYEALRAWLEEHFVADVTRLGDIHGLIVEHAKQHCKVRPRCDGCPLEGPCQFRPG